MWIDLRSDTITQPTDQMRKAMAEAEVGDDVYGEDPTVNRLEELAAEKIGKEKALFVTSGTMGNQIAILTHTKRGDEIITEERAHIFLYEAGGPAVLAGVQIKPVKGNVFGEMDPKDVEASINIDDVHFPRTSLITLENTFNRTGGTVLSLENLKGINAVAKENNLKVHMDGARIFNASIYLNKDVKEITQYVDSVQFCLSKGLSAPVGSILAGSDEFIAQARRYRKMLGGGIRQGGIIAAAGIVALENMVDRLIEDHDNARELSLCLSEIKGIEINLDTVHTNIIIFTLKDMKSWYFVEELKKRGIKANATTSNSVRFVTHKDFSKDCIPAVVKAVKEIMC